ncbi:rhodanese-like domain-containing protein [Mycoplasmatota bacterium WC30]
MFLAITDALNWIIPIALGLFIGYLIATRKKTSSDDIVYLEAEDFRANMRKGQLIDIRLEDDYKSNKINGSRSFPKKSITQNLFKLRADQAVFLYDNSESGKIKAVANKLVKKGYKPVYILKGGLISWPFTTKK